MPPWPGTVLFNTATFWLFYAVVVLAYRRLPLRGQNLLLLAASWIFYGAWSWRFLGLLVLTTVVDYAVAILVDRATDERRRRRLLWLSVAGNLGVLCAFKYAGFFAGELGRLLGAVGLPVSPLVLGITLPVGISFYTFQSLGYVLDVYRRRLPAERSFPTFALFIAFFPQLVAGPIERAEHLLPQLERPRRLAPGDFGAGLDEILWGLFLKVVVADNLSVVVDGVFGAPAGHPPRGTECLAGVYAFAFQIYGDFAGYSSIARGIARWLGFTLQDNFQRPYLAESPRDFWRRWHVTLSSWLRENLYWPLGGSRAGRLRTARNLLVTMALGGLWHGAAWTFVAWGAFHGILLVGQHALAGGVAGRSVPGRSGGAAPRASGALGRVARRLLMFHAACAGWLIFRAPSLAQAGAFAASIVRDPWPTSAAAAGLGLTAAAALVVMARDVLVERATPRLANAAGSPAVGVSVGAQPRSVGVDIRRGLGWAALLVSILALRPTHAAEFIYFRF